MIGSSVVLLFFNGEDEPPRGIRHNLHVELFGTLSVNQMQHNVNSNDSVGEGILYGEKFHCIQLEIGF